MSPNKAPDQSPFSISNLIGNTRHIVKLKADKTTVDPGQGTAKFDIPNGVDYNSTHQIHTKSLQVKTGDELSKSFDADASMSGSYASVAAEGSVKYSYQSALSASKYYGVLSYDYRVFMLTLKLEHGELDLEDGFIKEAKKLPEWPASGNPDSATYETYKEFFRNWGTYVIRSVIFGARFQVKIEHIIGEKESQSDFESHVKAEYNGVCRYRGQWIAKNVAKNVLQV